MLMVAIQCQGVGKFAQYGWCYHRRRMSNKANRKLCCVWLIALPSLSVGCGQQVEQRQKGALMPVRVPVETGADVRDTAPDASEVPSEPPVTADTITIVPVLTMRTSSGGVHIRVRVDNRGSAAIDVRPHAVQAISEPVGPTKVVSVTALGLPLGDMTADGTTPQPAAAGWIAVAPQGSLLLTLFLDHAAAAWDGHSQHRYIVELLRKGGPSLSVEASLNDAIRHRTR